MVLVRKYHSLALHGPAVRGLHDVSLSWVRFWGGGETAGSHHLRDGSSAELAISRGSNANHWRPPGKQALGQATLPAALPHTCLQQGFPSLQPKPRIITWRYQMQRCSSRSHTYLRGRLACFEYRGSVRNQPLQGGSGYDLLEGPKGSEVT